MEAARRKPILVLAAALTFALAGCPPTGPARTFGPVTLSVADTPAHVDYSDLKAVLRGAADKSGRLHVPRLKRRADRLEAQLRLLARAGPTATPELLPTDEDRLAYWINARCAWSLRLAMIEDFPKELPAEAMEDRPFDIDGRRLTLRQVDDEIAALGGWQACVAAPGVLMQRAECLDEPVSAADVRQRVQERLEDFIDDGDRFVLDAAPREILVPPVLWKYRGELLSCYCEETGAPSGTLSMALRECVGGSAHRRLQNAVGYACREAPPSRKLALRKLP